MERDFLLYQGRHGETILVDKTQAGWDFLIGQMENDNRVTFEELYAQDEPEVEGSYEQGYIFVDDGGRIDTISLTYPVV